MRNMRCSWLAIKKMNDEGTRNGRRRRRTRRRRKRRRGTASVRRRKRTCGSWHELKLSRSVPGVQCRQVAPAMTTVRATAAQTRRGQAVPKADTRASEKVVMSQKEICQVYTQQGQVGRRGVEAKSIQVVQGVRGAKEVDPRTSAWLRRPVMIQRCDT